MRGPRPVCRAASRTSDARRMGLPDRRQLATAAGAPRARPACGRRVSNPRAPPRARGPMRTHLTPLALYAVAIGSIAGCGSASTATTVAQSRRVVRSTTTHPRTVAVRNRRPVVPAPSYPRLLPTATGSTTSGLVPAVTVRGQAAVWLDRHTNVALLAFDQTSGRTEAPFGDGRRWSLCSLSRS